MMGDARGELESRRGWASRRGWYRLVIVAVAMVQWVGAVGVIAGDEPGPGAGPGVEWTRGGCLESSSPCFAPGKVDLLVRGTDADWSSNLILWTPAFKGGLGIVDADGPGRTLYAGGYGRPLALHPAAGDLIVGGAVVDTAAGTTFEVLAEHRLPSGLGFGAGHMSTIHSAADVTFAKLTYRGEVAKIRYVGAVLAQEVGSDRSPGGCLAVYDDRFMGVVGNDGEQWRATLGFVAPQRNGARLRPAVEALYVDNSIGERDGAGFVFVNGTLGFRGGFLSHPARLGRAMGPQGLEFGNPLGFLRPTWNRRLDPWELGGLASARWVRTDLHGRTLSETVEAVVFPAQLRVVRSWTDGLFIGGFRANEGSATTPGVIAGFSGRVGCFLLSGAARWSLDPDELEVVLGLIDRF